MDKNFKSTRWYIESMGQTSVHVRLPDGLNRYLEKLKDKEIIRSKAEHMRNLVREDADRHTKFGLQNAEVSAGE